MRWPWKKQSSDPELRDRINAIQERASKQLDASKAVVGSSHALAADARKLSEHAVSIRAKNHFAEAYLPSGPRKLKIPWKRS